jgi:ribosomal protein S18 acetylase RimI-like enzyme
LNKAVNDVFPLVIREATFADEAELLPMMRKLAEQEPGSIKFDEPAVRAALGRFLSLPAFGKVWLLCEGNKPVGYIVLTLGFSFEFHGQDAFIDELYVDAAYRRRGIGRQAMEFAEGKAREMGVNALHLEVDDGNDPALELYLRTGFEDHDRFLMTKWLDREDH